MQEKISAVVISVPHTGTNFTMKLFTDQGFKGHSLMAISHSPWTLYQGHVMKSSQINRALELAESMPLVIPMRHPYRVEESWRRRRKPVGEMVTSFQVLMERFVPLDPYFMPVDSPVRESALARLSAGLGVEFGTTWAVHGGETGTHDLALDDLAPSNAVRELVATMQPLISRFYNNTSQP